MASLVYLCLAPLALKIDQLPVAPSPENMMAAASALLKPQPLKQTAHVIKIDVRVRLPLQNPKAQLLMRAHIA